MNRAFLVWSSLLLVSAVTAAFAVMDLQAASKNCQAGGADLAAAQRLAVNIKKLLANRRVAKVDIDSPQELIDQVSESMQLSDISSEKLLSVTPGLPFRIVNSDYQFRQTQIALRQLSLPVLSKFASKMESMADATFVEDLAISPAESVSELVRDGTEYWDVRLTLTQIIYSPKSN